MFRTFVVPLDGSELAERALPYAVQLAQASGARLILTRAVVAPLPPMLEGSDWEQQQTDAFSDAVAYLNETAGQLAGKVEAVEITVAYGHAVDKIIEAVQTYAADAVVMATHGRTGFAHLLYGSVTEGILARSSVPVFAVYGRPGEAPAAPYSPTTARILVPLDGSANDDPTLETALNLVGARGELTLVTVAAPPEHVERDESGRRVLAYLDQQEEARTRAARDYLASIVDSSRHRQVQVRVNIDVRLGDPSSGIAMAAIDAQADLIVMATHGRTGLRRAVLGSVAGTVLRTASAPVVLVHPNQPDAAEPEPVRANDMLAAAPMF